MLLHCTERLAAKIPHEHFRNAGYDGSQGNCTPLGEWYGHLLLLDRRQCVLFYHDLTRYVFFLPGLRAPQFADLGHWLQELFFATLPARIRPSFLTHPGFVMVSTQRMEERNDENHRTEMGIASSKCPGGSRF